jgi:hypothetical protein
MSMHRPMKTVLRFAAIVAVVALLHILAPSTAPAGSPYLSALSSLESSTQAATHCADKTCASVGGGCVRSAGSFCAKSGGQCFTRGC